MKSKNRLQRFLMWVVGSLSLKDGLVELSLGGLVTRHPSNSTLRILVALFVAFVPNRASAQTDLSQIIGIPEHAHTLPVRFGFVNLDNGNLHLEIPLYSNPERGHPSLENVLVYDSSFWSSVNGTGQPLDYPTTSGWGGGGIYYPDQPPQAVAGTPYQVIPCSQFYGAIVVGSVTIVTSFTSSDPHNTTRTFNTSEIADAQCFYAPGQPNQGAPYPDDNDAVFNGYPQNGTAYASDGSGYQVTITKSNGVQKRYVTAPNGIAVTAQNPFGTTPNGNTYDISTSLVDELGESYPIGSGVTSISQLLSGGTYGFLSNEPYQAKSSVTGTLTRPGESGSYNYTWEYIPVCTGTTPSDYCGGMWTLGSIGLPDGDTYTFSYDQGTSPTHVGRLTGITLPTGGTVTYGYGANNCGLVSGTPFCGQVDSVADNGGTTTISYSGPNAYEGYGSSATGVPATEQVYYPVTVTFPPHQVTAGSPGTVQDNTVYSGANFSFVKTEYSGTATVLRTTTTTTDDYARATSVKSVWAATGESHEVDYKYADDSTLSGTMVYGQLGIDMVALETEYNSGTLVRSVRTTYQQDTASIPYVSQYNMINYPASVSLMNASGTVISQVQYTYDEYAASYCSQHYPTGLSGIPMLTSITGAAGHDDTNYGTGFVARGNPTTIAYTGQNVQNPMVLHRCYDTLGNLTQSIDGNGNATRYSYNDNFYESACLTSGKPTYAFQTGATDALGHATQTNYYSCLRAAHALQGPNDFANGRPGTIYEYDAEFRPTCILSPDGGQVCNSYPSATETDVSTLLNSSGTTDKVQNIEDTFGRVISTIDNGAGTETDTQYDAFNRVSSVSNAHSTTGSSSTDGVTSFAYDAFGRKVSQQQQDQSMQVWQYSGNSVTFTDEAGRQWIRTSDSLGRLIKIFEPNGSTMGTSPTMETDYGYDVLNDLTSVTQWGGANGASGARMRSFTYDGLSHLLSAANPESGASQYAYDSNGNVVTKISPAVNTTGTQTQTIGYCYDALNRMTFKFYSATFNCGSPSGYAASYAYDSSSVSGAQNVIGQLSDERSYVGSTLVAERQLFSYDPMGRLLNENQYTIGNLGGKPFAPSYVYDLVGNVVASTDGATPITSANTQFPCTTGAPSWNTLGFIRCYDGDARLASVTSNWAALPTNLFNSSAYWPTGQLQSWKQGSNLAVAQGYTNRLWINSILATGQVP